MGSLEYQDEEFTYSGKVFKQLGYYHEIDALKFCCNHAAEDRREC